MLHTGEGKPRDYSRLGVKSWDLWVEPQPEPELESESEGPGRFWALIAQSKP
jgi:hypothetical protein